MHTIKRGLDLPIAGKPVQAIEDGVAVSRVALLGADYVGLKPTMHVQPGDQVLRGQLLFEDKKSPGVRHTAPAAGRVADIHRGEKRAFVSVVIEVSPDDGPQAQATFANWGGAPPREGDGPALRALLLESGLWTAFRTRPFSRVPAPDAVPEAIFVTAMDSRPLAPSMEVALAGREEEYAEGILALRDLTPGTVFVCRAPGSTLRAPRAERIAIEEFAGPHPAGLSGTHIHFLHPAGHGRSVWHVGAQDVAAIGHLLATGKLDVARVISLAGPGIARPRLLRTRLGASLAQLAANELVPGEQRVVSGSVLDGRTAMSESVCYLGRHHQQVSALPEGRARELLGWIAPGTDKFSVAGVVLGAFSRARARPFSTTTNGSKRAMVPIGTHEAVMPLDILATFLLRALLSRDLERAEALGALELDEEDLALCTYADPGKNDYAPLLREALSRLEKEG
ncbi:MAG TPA: Na(+)-translocating NADH-quinone reductase subunit A [Usitatibacteraceae bacterium]|nr:Na(+)-translocating NADH-quinone reductase subunit A [Usitatibacteraceae bacterium]